MWVRQFFVVMPTSVYIGMDRRHISSNLEQVLLNLECELQAHGLEVLWPTRDPNFKPKADLYIFVFTAEIEDISRQIESVLCDLQKQKIVEGKPVLFFSPCRWNGTLEPILRTWPNNPHIRIVPDGTDLYTLAECCTAECLAGAE